MKDINAVNKLLKAYGHNETLHYDKWSEKHKYRALNNGHLKQWISNIVPFELLERPLKKAIESIVSLCECTTFYKKFPDEIKKPNYGDKWGRHGNYIEINNRAICEMHNQRCKNGIISTIKLLPAIRQKAGQIVLYCHKFGQTFTVTATTKNRGKKTQYTELNSESVTAKT